MLEASDREDLRDPYVREGLWYLAARGSLEEKFQRDPTFQTLMLKTFVFATLLEVGDSQSRAWSSEELLSLGPVSLRALNDATGLAPSGSPRELLFLREPELSDTIRDGYYHYLRIDARSIRKRIIMERVDDPWSDLGLNYAVTHTEPLTEDGQDDYLPAEGLSYTFPMRVLNHFVIAAKAYACLSLIGEESSYAKYLHLIIANAFFAASLIEGNGHSAVGFSRTAIFPMRKAIHGFRRNPVRHGEALTAAALEPRLTVMNFLGRKLSSAAIRYRNASVQEHLGTELSVVRELG